MLYIQLIIAMEDSGAKKEFVCTECDTKFDSRGKKNIHIDRIHKQSKTIQYSDGIVRTSNVTRLGRDQV